MGLPLITRSPAAPSTSFCSSPSIAGAFDSFPAGLKTAAAVRKERRVGASGLRVRASVERRSTGEGVDGRGGEGESGGGVGYRGSAMEVTTFNRGFEEAELALWEKIGAVVRLSYGIGEPSWFSVNFRVIGVFIASIICF